jgi:hypothetical protein
MLGGSLYKPFGNFNCLRSSLYQLLLTNQRHIFVEGGSIYLIMHVWTSDSSVFSPSFSQHLFIPNN